MAGPGFIAATSVAARAGGDLSRSLSLMAIVVLVMALTYLALISAARISRELGATGQSVLTRMLGVALAGLAVQFVIDGVRTATGEPTGAAMHSRRQVGSALPTPCAPTRPIVAAVADRGGRG